MQSYLKSMWKCRYFWWSLARNDLRTRYRRSVLGIAWSMLQPIAMTAVVCTVFHKLWQVDLKTFAPSLMVGMCFWNFLTATVLQGGQCLFQGEPYIRQFPAPLAIYPLRTVLGATFHLLMSLSVVLLLRWILLGFDNIPALVALAPTMLVLFLFGWSLAVLSGFITAYFPDMQHLSEVGLQILFYGTPIIYPADLLRERGMGWLVDWNPLAALVQMVRDPLLAGTVPPMQILAVGLLTLACSTCLAILTLHRLQSKIIFQL